MGEFSNQEAQEAVFNCGRFIDHRSVLWLQGGRVVSVAVVRQHFHMKTTEITLLATHPKFRRQGHASALIRGICAAATQLGSTHVVACVETAQTHAFWEAMGFQSALPNVPAATPHLSCTISCTVWAYDVSTPLLAVAQEGGHMKAAGRGVEKKAAKVTAAKKKAKKGKKKEEEEKKEGQEEAGETGEVAEADGANDTAAAYVRNKSQSCHSIQLPKPREKVETRDTAKKDGAANAGRKALSEIHNSGLNTEAGKSEKVKAGMKSGKAEKMSSKSGEAEKTSSVKTSRQRKGKKLYTNKLLTESDALI